MAACARLGEVEQVRWLEHGGNLGESAKAANHFLAGKGAKGACQIFSTSEQGSL